MKQLWDCDEDDFKSLIEDRLVVQGAETYQQVLEERDRMEAIEGIKRGLQSIKNNAGKPGGRVFPGILC